MYRFEFFFQAFNPPVAAQAHTVLGQVVSRRRNEQKPKTETKEKTDEAGISPRRQKFCTDMNQKSPHMGMFENWLWGS